jgi:hypothetical protein
VFLVADAVQHHSRRECVGVKTAAEGGLMVMHR